ncbi:MAG: Gfo/Idh/MocA family oxidoreductase [Actinomycetota bacterium]|nr:Gfo/Idh/MocA family oxidoreductase [Actinomycetota bacterium]
MTVGWGVVATGGIARRFASAMQMVEGGEIAAVSSRSMPRAEEFAREHAIPRAYDDVAALAADDRVDAVYVATPHSRHLRDALTAIGAGKAVLCEKPLALSAHQVGQMVDAARAGGTFLMEALWSRFLPAYRRLADVLAEGRIGQPLLVEADFGFRIDVQPDSRYFDRSLGGGALLDLGIYPLHLCQLVLGPPDRVTADGQVGATGVDEQVAAVLHHPSGSLGVVKAAIRVPMGCQARIAGSDGWIDIPAFMHCPDHFDVRSPQGSERIDATFEGDGLRFEIEEVHRCMAAGSSESTVMALHESLSMAQTMDSIRSHLGVIYPEE